MASRPGGVSSQGSSDSSHRQREVVERLFRGESYSFLEVVGSEAPCRAIDGGIAEIGGDYGVILG